VPMLGALPLISGLKKSTEPLTLLLDHEQSSFAESIRTIRTGLVLSGLDKPQKVTVITSSVPGEGKSTLSLNLAAAMGQMEKTLLIDADMRRPTLAKICELAPNTPGLSNFMAGTAPLSECVHRFEAAGVDVLPAGVIPPNPLDLISSSRFVETLDALKAKYDRILIDSAPTQAVSDAFVLASYADALIYVIKADATPYTLAKHGIQRLQNSNAPVTGVVLNQFDVSKASKYGGDYHHFGGYYDYYGYSSDSDDKVKSIRGGKKPSKVA
jgi:succinoglycan biosynthesis transport protein ExoP